MPISRREFLIGLGLLAAGCATNQVPLSSRPGPAWPAGLTRPETHGPGLAVAPEQPIAAAPSVGSPAISAISRSQWASRGPVMARLNPMNGVNRITVHHEGWTPAWFTDQATTAKRLDQIRRNHVDKGWADIAYHYIIDRAGRVWEGRNTRYQGAHVHEQNEHNVGILVLGNFDTQRPSDAQINALAQTLRALMNYYNVPVTRVYTHRELNSSTCPGRNLQSRMNALRRSGRL
jgi:hypothetical protein